MQLRDPAVHVVLNSRDVIGETTSLYAWTSKAFHDANPKTYQAIVAAIKEASVFIMANRRQAAEYFASDTKAKVELEEIVNILGVAYDPTPLASATWANFMHRVGRNKNTAGSRKDLFFPEIHDLPGS